MRYAVVIATKCGLRAAWCTPDDPAPYIAKWFADGAMTRLPFKTQTRFTRGAFCVVHRVLLRLDRVSKKRRYTDEERASLIAMLESEGYPDRVGALQKVATYANVHTNVLRRWFNGTRNPPPTEMVTHKKIDFAAAINEELASIFLEMGAKRADADYRTLGTVAGILLDKKQLLEGKPTQNIKNSGAIILKTGMGLDDL